MTVLEVVYIVLTKLRRLGLLQEETDRKLEFSSSSFDYLEIQKELPSIKEEIELRKLVQLVEERKPLEIIAVELKKSKNAIYQKCHHLGAKLLEEELEIPAKSVSSSTSSLKIPKELPSVEEALMILAGALEAACQHGLDKVEVHRLQVIGALARTYKEILADYLDYRGTEKKLDETLAKLREHAKKGQALSPSRVYCFQFPFIGISPCIL